jgi:uncharacterized membrane protein YphA (DoxX/SURF4 family)
MMNDLVKKVQRLSASINYFDFTAPLLIRLYLVPILWMAGYKKMLAFDSTVQWFGNADWGLGLPFPWLLAFMVTSVELVGAVLLLIGLAVRWISIPLMMTMVVAGYLVHWGNGWLAIAEGSGWFANERTIAATQRLEKAKEILQEHGHYSWLTEAGNFVVLNNGIEFAATYSIMLLALIFTGGGRFVSIDYWLQEHLAKKYL